MRKILSIDAETDGLWGKPFAIAAIVYEDGVETDRFLARMADNRITNEWVMMYVLPAIADIRVTHNFWDDMLRDFSDFYKKHKEGAEVIAHMGYIVEAYLFRLMHEEGFIGDFDGPYPLFDVSGNLQAAGYDPTSVDAYVKDRGLVISDYGTTHNPLYDAEVAAQVYMHLTHDL
jgi:hypothetical protein